MIFNDFSGFVLAGGKSSRMKTDKAFLEIDGETFLARAVKTLSKTCENSVEIVLNQSQTHFIAKFPAGVSYVFDIYENLGALGGIHAALKNCPREYAFVLACDMPFVTEKAVANLARTALESAGKSAIIPKDSDGKIQPLAAVYKVKTCLPLLENFLANPSSNAVRDFLKLVPTEFIAAESLDADENLFSNVNFPSDYQKISHKPPVNNSADWNI